LVVGSLIFFNSGNPYGPQINVLVVYAVGGAVGLFGLSLVFFIVRAQRRRVTTGVEGMVGDTVTALTPLQPEGRVRYHGENWAAILEPPTTSAVEGAELQIIAVEGLRLRVRPLYPPADTSVNRLSTLT
ncbi:MAG: hypothetical protein IMW89_12040, partial [Ktedonobacteraceae bacterium]|nr:hypothetical protein [Ktedonobacteraceae bacterium]